MFVEMNTIILATPHSRNDPMVQSVSQLLSDHRVIRVRTEVELTPENLKSLSPNWIFFPHWSRIIPKPIFESFRCVIFHMTDLPFGRGGSPLQNLIIRGLKETKLSAIRCTGNVDAGAIYLKRHLDLSGSAEEILKRASDLMAEMVVEIVRKEPLPLDQIGDVVTFKRRQPKDSSISQLASLDKIYDHIRMLDAEGYPPACLDYNGFVYEFFDSENHGKWVDARVRIKRSEKE